MAVLYFTGNWALPSGKIPDGIFLQAQECAFALGSRFLPCAKGALSCAQTKTSLRLSSPYAGKAVCLLPRKRKNLLKSRFLNILPGIGPCLPVKFLTEFSCRPGSRFLPCAKGAPFTRANKNIAPPFKSLRRQSSLPASPETKNLLKSRFRAKKEPPYKKRLSLNGTGEGT